MSKIHAVFDPDQAAKLNNNWIPGTIYRQVRKPITDYDIDASCLRRKSRMHWLYNMIMDAGRSHEYSLEARRYLHHRVSTLDYTAREKRDTSKWWEDTMEPARIPLHLRGPYAQFPTGVPMPDADLPYDSPPPPPAPEDGEDIPGPPPGAPSEAGSDSEGEDSDDDEAPEKKVTTEEEELAREMLVEMAKLEKEEDEAKSLSVLSVTMREVLKKESLSAALRTYLEEAESNTEGYPSEVDGVAIEAWIERLELIDEIQRWHDRFFSTVGPASPASAGVFDLKTLAAKKIYLKCFDSKKPKSPTALTLPAPMRQRMMVQLGIALDGNEEKVLSEEEENMFKKSGAREDIFKDLLSLLCKSFDDHLLPRFAHSQEYRGLTASETALLTEHKRAERLERVRDIVAAKRQAREEAKKQADDEAEAKRIAEAEEIQRRANKPVAPPSPPSDFALPYRAPKPRGWLNEGGWRTLCVELTEWSGHLLDTGGFSKSTNDDKSQRSSLYCHVSVDSCTLKSREANGLRQARFDEYFEFQLLNTTQFLDVAVYKSVSGQDVFMGYVLLPIADIIERMKSEGVNWTTLHDDVSAISQASGRALPDCDVPPKTYRVMLPHGHETSSHHMRLVDLDVVMKVSLSRAKHRPDATHKKIIHVEEKSSLADAIRGKVSKKKKRFVQDGFDLDLTYVTPNIIAMGFPSIGSEGIYRNHMDDVKVFFHKRHPGAYRIYNLCSERAYEAAQFEGSACRYPFDDHNPCPMEILKGFCEDVRKFLSAHPQNVVAIHCKAGKGRTGTVIAAYLVYCRFLASSQLALNYFGNMRTKNGKGVTIPSQMRYVHYFDSFCRIKSNGALEPGQSTLFLHALIIHNYAKSACEGGEVFFTLKQTNKAKYGSNHGKEAVKAQVDKASNTILFDFSQRTLAMEEDCKFDFFVETSLSTKKLFHCWLNTRFQPLRYCVNEEERARLKDAANRASVKGADDDDDDDDDEDDEEDEEEDEEQPGETPASPGASTTPFPTSPSLSAAASPTAFPGSPSASSLPHSRLSGVEEKKDVEKKKDKEKEKGKASVPVPLYPCDTAHRLAPQHPRLLWTKMDLDKAIKDKKHKKFPADFQIELVFANTAISSTLKNQELLIPQVCDMHGLRPVPYVPKQTPTKTTAIF